MPALRVAALLAVLLPIIPPAIAQTPPFALEVVAEGLSQPLFATAPVGDSRLFVVEQTGAIRILDDGAMIDEAFLDLSGFVGVGNERGLLGLAFHPDYASNGRFYVNYTDRQGDTQVVSYAVSGDPNVAVPESAEVLLSVPQPYGNHNGGWVAFGPDDLLYVGMGDGGSRGDPAGNGQNPDALLGKILRFDVDAGSGPEIFVSGVRNPWRNAFDGEDFYIADVGQNQWEEISVISLDDGGANLGWDVMEGFDCFEPAQGCDEAGLVQPVYSYSHSEGCSVTGGYVYRGTAIPEIDGLYFFADYCSGILSSFRFNGEGISDGLSYADVFGSIGPITSFGLDSSGELYLTVHDGRLVKFVPR